ncbi:unnamed protein product, partial [Oikopleura dioica]
FLAITAFVGTGLGIWLCIQVFEMTQVEAILRAYAVSVTANSFVLGNFLVLLSYLAYSAPKHASFTLNSSNTYSSTAQDN